MASQSELESFLSRVDSIQGRFIENLDANRRKAVVSKTELAQQPESAGDLNTEGELNESTELP